MFMQAYMSRQKCAYVEVYVYMNIYVYVNVYKYEYLFVCVIMYGCAIFLLKLGYTLCNLRLQINKN